MCYIRNKSGERGQEITNIVIHWCSMQVRFSGRTTATSHFPAVLFCYLIESTNDFLILICYLASKEDQRPPDFMHLLRFCYHKHKIVCKIIFHIRNELIFNKANTSMASSNYANKHKVNT